MSVNIKDSSKPNGVRIIAGRIADDKYSYQDALSLEEIEASTPSLLTNKIPNAEALKDVNNNFVRKISDTGYIAVEGLGYDATNQQLMLKVGADSVIPFSSGTKRTYTSITASGYMYETNSQNSNWTITVQSKEFGTTTHNVSLWGGYGGISGSSTSVIMSGTQVVAVVQITGNGSWNGGVFTITIYDLANKSYSKAVGVGNTSIPWSVSVTIL